MKLCISGDWQLDSAPAHDRLDPATGRSTRFGETVAVIEQVLDAGRAAGAEGLLHLGDLVETKNPKAIELEAAAHLFSRVLKPGGRVWAIAGNHDGSLFEVSGSSFSPLAAMRTDAFKLFHQVELDDELGMLAVPYIHKATPEEIATMIRGAWTGELGHPRGFFGAIHYGVIGADGTPCAVGPRNLVIAGNDYLGAEQLLACGPLTHVFAGHIHKAQQLALSPKCQAYLPGSPVICDHGEREDRKTWILFDTDTREVTVHEIPQPRRWITLTYRPEMAAEPWDTSDPGSLPWSADDIVKVTGTYEKPDYPKDTLEKAFKLGLPRPFALEIAVTQAKAERATRELQVSAEGGMRQAVQDYVRDRYHRDSDKPNQIGPATALVLDTLREQGGQSFAPQVDPVEIEISQFLTVKAYKDSFRQGVPTLIVGPNGIGKTNFMDAPLWCLTGQTSKGLGLAQVVRQGEQVCEVSLTLKAHGGDHEAVMLRVTRGVKLSKANKPTQKLALEQLQADGTWKGIADGGIEDAQRQINALIGGSYLTLRATAFKFQWDASPLIRARPQDRKAVIGEVSGLEPLQRAHKVLDAKRLESARALDQAKDRLSGMAAAGEGAAERQTQLEKDQAQGKTDQAAAEAAVPVAAQQVLESTTADTAARAAVAAVQKALDGLPNTQADLSGAEAALKAHETGALAGVEALRKRYAEASARLKEAETKLAALKAPDPAEVEALAKAEAASRSAYELMETQAKALTGTAGAAMAEASAAEKALTQAKQDLATAQGQLSILTPPDGGNLADELARGEAALAAADKSVQDLAGESSRAQAGLTLAEIRIKDVTQATADSRAKLLKERAKYSGVETGPCPTCNQPIDAKHLEKELARIDADLKAEDELGAKMLATAEAAKQTATKAAAELQTQLGKAALAKTQLQTELKALADKVQAQAVARQAWQTAEAREAECNAKLPRLSQVVEEATLQARTLQVQLQAAQDQAAGRKATWDGQAQQLRAMREVGTQLGALTAQVDSGRQALADLEKEGKEAAAKAEASGAVLKKALEDAHQAHAANEATAAALRHQLQGAQAQAGEATDALVAARTRQAQADGELKAVVQRLADLEAQLKQLAASRQALETARFELATLEERAAIDATAAALVDPKQGLPVFLIDQALPFLEDRINHYMSQLGMDRLTVSLSTLEEDKETLAVLVDNGRPGPRLDVAAFSGGQLDRVEYAFKFALEDLRRQSRGVTFGLLAFDEPTGGLDAAGKQGLIQLFHERCGAYPVSLVVSHDEELIRSFDHRLQFSQGAEDETVIN